MTAVFDSSEVDKLAADLLKVAAATPAAVRPIAQKAGVNIKADWRAAWSGLGHAPLLPQAITFDTKEGPGLVELEVGPDKDRPQGALGNVIEFGTVNNAPRPGGAAALQREAAKVERVVGEIAEQIL